jgi:hypothetical protein
VGLLGAVLCAGCDVASLTYFLLPENREDPEYRPLLIKDKDRGIKVAILIYTPLEVQTSFVQLDRQLGEMLAEELRSLSEANRQKIQVVPAQVVEAFKNSHARWQTMDTAEIGRSLRADYVISLEINKFSLVEPGTSGMLLRGHAQVSATLVDVAHPDDTPLPREVPYVYPAEGPMQSEFDLDRNTFRQKYLGHLARRLSYLFLAHPKRDRMVD